MVVGNIYNDEDGKYIIDYRFIKLNASNFVTLYCDVTEFDSEDEAINSIKLDNYFYKIVLQGVYHIDIKRLADRLLEEYDNIIKIENATTPSIDIQEISKENSIRGTFAKLMIDELEKHPEKSNMIYEAIENVLK